MARRGNLEKEPDEQTMGGKMRLARQAFGASITSMGKATGYDIGYLSNVERGGRKATQAIVHTYAELLEAPELETFFLEGREAGPRSTDNWAHRHVYSFQLSGANLLKCCPCGLAYVATIGESPVWIQVMHTNALEATQEGKTS